MEPPDPSTFPKAPRFGTYCPSRSAGKFKTHTTMGHAKNAVGGQTIGHNTLYEAWVYEYVDDTWVLRWHVPHGTNKKIHPLWAPQYVMQELP